MPVAGTINFIFTTSTHFFNPFIIVTFFLVFQLQDYFFMVFFSLPKDLGSCFSCCCITFATLIGFWIVFLDFLGESYDWRKNMLRKELLRISNFGSSNLAVNPHWAVFQDETRSVYVYIFYVGSHEYRHLCVECSFGLL